MLVVFGVISVIMIGLTNTIQGLRNRSASLARKQKYIQLVDNLRKSLEDPHLCYLMLGGQRINAVPGGIRTANVQIDLLQPLPGGAPASRFLRAGWIPTENSFRVRSVNFRTVGRNIIASKDAVGNIQSGNRVITFDRPINNIDNKIDSWHIQVVIIPQEVVANETWRLNINLNNPAAIDPRFIIDLDVNINPNTRVIHACHGRTSIAAVCEGNGGSYDATALTPVGLDPRYRCQPNYRCWPEQYVAPNGQPGLRRTPEQPFPNPPVQPNCPAPYTQKSWVGRLNGQDLWSCEWCNQNQGTISF